MENITRVETGRTGRIAYARIGPNEDLVTGIEKMCVAERFEYAIIRGGLGSLTDAHLYTINGEQLTVEGPAIEILSLVGEVRMSADGSSLRATVSGVVADTDGYISGGEFVPGMNAVCITAEIVVEEWLPENTREL